MKKTFKKITLISAAFVFFLSSPVLAGGPVDQGTGVFGFGIGAAGTYYGYSGFSPGVKLNYEQGLWKAGPGVITLGATFGFSYQAYRYRYIWGNNYNYSWANFIIAARSAWHHNWGVDNLDTYAGASAGVRFAIFNDGGDPTPPKYNSVFPHFGGFIGAAYYFKPTLGAFAEFGYDINFVTIGLNLKFGK